MLELNLKEETCQQCMLKKDSLKNKNLLSSCVVTNKELLGNPSLVVNAVAQI